MFSSPTTTSPTPLKFLQSTYIDPDGLPTTVSYHLGRLHYIWIFQERKPANLFKSEILTYRKKTRTKRGNKKEMTGFTNFGEDKKKTKSLGPTPTSKRQMVTQKKRTFTNLALVKVHISLVGLQKKTVEP